MEINLINLFLVANGILLISASLHYREPGKKLEYSPMNGFAKNLTKKGKIIFWTGLAMEIAGLAL